MTHSQFTETGLKTKTLGVVSACTATVVKIQTQFITNVSQIYKSKKKNRMQMKMDALL